VTRDARRLAAPLAAALSLVAACAPTPAPVARPGVRGDVARSALSFIGQPYRWGADDGAFDCSGLTMAAYRLNGLGLPRSSAEQFAAGLPVGVERLREADLVFFAIEAKGRPSHVGLYVGDGRFVHAPGAGKPVRLDELSSSYYQRRFLSARSYLD
jgi:cell wall-associated NlpC family hydrolase